MMMPKLNFDEEILKSLSSKATQDNLTEIFNSLKSEQGEDFELRILLMGLINIEFAKGFMYAYLLIKDAMIKKSIDDLENIVK